MNRVPLPEPAPHATAALLALTNPTCVLCAVGMSNFERNQLKRKRQEYDNDEGDEDDDEEDDEED